MDVFMPLLSNVIHYNSSFLDEEIVSGIVRLVQIMFHVLTKTCFRNKSCCITESTGYLTCFNLSIICDDMMWFISALHN